MRATVGGAFLVMGSLLATAGFAVSSQKHLGLEPIDIATVMLLWLLSASIVVFHEKIFRRDRILPVVIPVLALAFVWLLLNLGYLMSFGIRDFNLYSILLGWCFFNSGLYYDTREVLKAGVRE
jgi:hypothetical protein